MSFATMVEDDLDTFLNNEEHATSITYSGTTIDAIVEYGDSGRDVDYNRDFKATRATIKVKVSDVSSPAYRDAVVISSNTWRVMREIEGDGYWWIIGIERLEKPDMSA